MELQGRLKKNISLMKKLIASTVRRSYVLFRVDEWGRAESSLFYSMVSLSKIYTVLTSVGYMKRVDVICYL